MTSKICTCDLNECGLYLDIPITLPCGWTVCKIHLEGFKNKYKCSFCDEEHIIPENGFQTNKTLLKMINAGLHLKQNQKNVVDYYTILQSLIEKYDSIDSETFIYDKFSKIRNKVDLHREKLVGNIFKRSDEILKQLDQQEKKCKSFISKTKRVDLDVLKNQRMIAWKNELRNPNKSQSDLENLSIKINEDIQYVQNVIEKCESKLLMNKNIDFLPIDDSSFGELIMDESESEISSLDQALCLQTFNGHSNLIRTFQLNEYCNKIISGSTDNTIKIWNYETGNCNKTIDSHKNSVTSILLYSINYFISGSIDKTIKIWDLNNYECIKTLNCDSGINSLCLMGDSMLASGTCDGLINIWNLKSYEKLKTIKAHEKSISFLILNNDNNRLISCSDDKSIKVWNMITNECLKILNGHSDIVRCLDIRSDDILFSGSDDKTIKLWDLNSGICVKTIDFNAKIFCLKSLSDDLVVIGSSSNNNLVIYDLSLNEIIKKLVSHSNFVNCLQLIKHNEYLMSGSKDKSIKLWKL